MNETLETLINVSNDKTSEFKKASEKAQEEQQKLIMSAWAKIYDYLCNIRDMGFRGSVSIENIYLYWLNKSEEKPRKTEFYFHDDKIVIYESSYGSSLNLNFGENIPFLPDQTDFKYCVKRMVTKWSEIKPRLEEVLQKTLTDRMMKAEHEKQSIESMNEKLAAFEV